MSVSITTSQSGSMYYLNVKYECSSNLCGASISETKGPFSSTDELSNVWMQLAQSERRCPAMRPVSNTNYTCDSCGTSYSSTGTCAKSIPYTYYSKNCGY